VKAKRIIIAALSLVFLLLPFSGKLPIPADTIPGLYYPMHEIDYGYPNGVPTKNPLITDPVRQQFAWKYLAIQELKQGNWPLWNPYNMSGTPLLANFQTAAFYPLNIVFLLPNIFGFQDIHWFGIQWSYYIYLQTLLAFLFMYLYLKKIGLTKTASFFGSLSWSFCGFITAWWEWGNVVHTLIYFPLMLYTVECIIESDPVDIIEHKAIYKSLFRGFAHLNRNKLIFLLALVASFLAGHLQTFLMVLINVGFYILYKIPLATLSPFKKGFFSIEVKWELTHRRIYYWIQLAQVFVLFTLLIAIQFLPTYDLVQKSARNIDPTAWQRLDWFFPLEHFAGIIAPDIFGNPSTYNYWGVWNYGEFAVYIGIIPLIFALSVIMQFLSDQLKKILPHARLGLNHREAVSDTLDLTMGNTGAGFFIFALLINLVLITKNPFTVMIYSMQVPFLTTTQPSRGIAIVEFSLVTLSAIGFNQMLKASGKKLLDTTDFYNNKANVNFAYIFLILVLIALWIINIFHYPYLLGVLEKAPNFDIFKIALSNLILPTILIIIATVLVRTLYKRLEGIYETVEQEESEVANKVKKDESARIDQKFLNILRTDTVNKSLITGILILTILDVGRFFYKFESFSPPKFLYPQLELFKPVENNPTARYMSERSEILAPNMNIPYAMQSVEGYDPLYLDQYGKFIGLWTRDKADFSPNKANRILTPQTVKSIVADISATNYLFSLGDYTVYDKKGEFGQTKLYERNTALPRTLILPALRAFKNEQDLAQYLFSGAFGPYNEALVIMKETEQLTIPQSGFYMFLGSKENKAEITTYTPTKVELIANLADAPGVLYLADTFDEGWTALVDGQEQTIMRANFNFRALQLTQGDHKITMSYNPQSFQWGYIITTAGVVITFLLLILSKKK
jgi:hypothetical protein